jgi:quercetin dioxygenase-like cupin family protein
MKYVRLKNLTDHSRFPGFSGKFVRSEQMTLVFWKIEAGAELPSHSHVHEQVAHTIEGQFEITVEGETTILEPGTVFVIPSNAVHSGRALSECRILDVFAPVREDYISLEN